MKVIKIYLLSVILLYAVTLNANNLPSGVYFYTIVAHSSTGTKEFINTKKLLLLK